ncbi:N-formylglutamate amidohydrolase [Palleronia caenipelagi]|uniref:N-formylglutamate amidohydrolase n=1 Tax=Palleronia caenipelagi TaxID=2489174 RepID=A0A547Q706_9RHOB|nr:N-formylglutamate amidohydrolase [Palleronia caenipelagi]TRD22170.1 N-formylglutamate amidohydrolase [Palleronia caenipelagi]
MLRNENEPTKAYDLHLPEVQTSSVVFASPHSGRGYCAEFIAESILTPAELRSSEDAHVDRLFEAAPSCGAPLLAAHWPRAWVDVNRAEDEIDPAMVLGVRRQAHNPRVASGLGVIPRVVAGGKPIRSGKLTRDEAERRLQLGWRPYHARLDALLRETQSRFGRATLIDCHSMPHEALDHVRRKGRRPDVVLGNRFGASASLPLMDLLDQLFTEQGFTVSRNVPFAGAYIAQQYGKPALGRHVVQVEIDRSLYMDEATLQPHRGFDEVKERLDRIIGQICDSERGAVLAAE